MNSIDEGKRADPGQIGATDQVTARDLLETPASKDTQAPAYLSEVAPPEPGEETREDRRSMPLQSHRVADAVPQSVRNRFLEAGKAFHYRDRDQAVAFEDKGTRLTTAQDDVHVIRAMIDVAEARGWSSVRVRGSVSFKREAWLQAQARGMVVEGYKPRHVDQARREDQARDRAVSAKSRSSDIRSDPVQPLSGRQQTAVEVLKAVLRERGDSEIAVEMAGELMRQRFLTHRVYIGRVKDIGTAPYQDNPGNADSPYVTLQTQKGETKVWGIDLPRALEEGRVQLNDEIALAFQGRKPVTLKRRETDKNGQTQVVEKQVERNAWDAKKLDALRDEVRLRLTRAAAEPSIPVYDRKAPQIVETAQRIRRPNRNIERTR
ncbi:LPD7 domain-containing protein [Asticcacaulis sp. YBE204]|uniref:LPD7 domain-containing protein n=1 Tax=Asticcacaulis sp. YBE204 TaxID=1282363 RepID=UPI0003C3BA35|nr:LPD7 domain-containing protein [Asticcacaulis sp. YBE204]ESQ79282.1 hypothetical protein AEYBE204_09745 [Asticcacaulis sp. YBE204]